jgi:hypothetical protein
MRQLLFVGLISLAVSGCAKDVDDDGFSTKEDCDDGDAAAYPGNEEICDGIDNNCDGTVDEGTATDALTFYADGDGDGFGDVAAPTQACEKPEGYVADATDCDDDNDAAYPDNLEVCDDADNDCDGTVDEDDAIDAPTWYRDLDDDGVGGDTGTTLVQCDQPAGYADVDGDCDDDDDTTYPGAAEVCDDGVDNKCEEDLAFDCDDTDCTADAACVPELTAVSPGASPTGTSIMVTLSGVGFDFLTAGTTTVSFGTVGDCTGVTVVDATTVTCNTPASSTVQTVDVTLTNANGSSTLSGGFRYANVIYAADGKSATAGNLYTIDVVDGTNTTVGPLVDSGGATYSFTGMAFSPEGALYGVTSTSFSGASQLTTIDPGTAQVTVIGDITRADGTIEYALPDITFVGSRLIGWTESGDDPVEIDLTTGTSTVLGAGTNSAGSGMATDRGGKVWFVPRGDVLWVVDASTGDVTSTGVTVSGLAGSTINSMTFFAGGLYATDAERGDTSPSALVRLDTTTGVATKIGDLSNAVDAIASQAP